MDNSTQGVLLALASAFVFAFYMAPRKGSLLNDFQFPASMALGILLTMALATLLARQFILKPFPGQFHAFLGGLIWGTGTAAFAASVRIIGLARSTPIKDASIVLGVLLGAIFFQEIPPSDKPLQFLAALLGSILIVSAAFLLQLTLVPASDKERKLKSVGITLALITCVAHALYLLPTRMSLAVAPSVFAVLLNQSLGILTVMFLPSILTGEILNWFRQPLAAHSRAWLSGSLWASGQMLLWFAIRKAGVAVPWGIAGLNNVMAIAYGIVVFKEIHVGRHRREVVLGLLSCLLGTFLLTIARR